MDGIPPNIKGMDGVTALFIKLYIICIIGKFIWGCCMAVMACKYEFIEMLLAAPLVGGGITGLKEPGVVKFTGFVVGVGPVCGVFGFIVAIGGVIGKEFKLNTEERMIKRSAVAIGTTKRQKFGHD